ncbi:hypothetical protein A2634_04395 [Candidatus Amesbacteria bacterium RIFCSPHIGHO2_01_FULL_48_32]|uniref:Uncharacterized protein n=1 Tax=Candidatus Amesbacteria bacterium RIFCSPLOWO2_01_FULL_48_25 TaxID=1797259 RepID=A0A1F4ZBP0_9BACT|nr:MAG: hypothetical protein A2634_04395 [Candidatus Amesbacteria bacterium RIFCSPHIGHO2_01_FULL_48_32]OGD03789.1 MAG: hypothetical protein A2989_03860 [Candidatus Amesbacteria bacterium RIFCSPLOWO2_01_FULL_48_25]HJZ05104.1 hypothetical protein [Patescibacteria group bacterium]
MTKLEKVTYKGSTYLVAPANGAEKLSKEAILGVGVAREEELKAQAQANNGRTDHEQVLSIHANQ